MNKILLLLSLGFCAHIFPAESLANKVCHRFFQKLQKACLPQVEDPAPFKITRAIFNQYIKNTAKNINFEAAKQCALEVAACCFHELCTEFESTATFEQQIQLAAELDVAFMQKSPGYLDRLCGLERADKVSIDSMEKMGESIFKAFQTVLSKAGFLKKIAKKPKKVNADFWPKNFVFSTNDPVLLVLEKNKKADIELRLTEEQDTLAQNTAKHWSKQLLQDIAYATEIKRTNSFLLKQECKTMQDSIDQQVVVNQKVFEDTIARFAKVSKTPALYTIGSWVQFVAHGSAISIVSYNVFSSLSPNYKAFNCNVADPKKSSLESIAEKFKMLPVGDKKLFVPTENEPFISKLANSGIVKSATKLATDLGDEFSGVKLAGHIADKVFDNVGLISNAVVVVKNAFSLFVKKI